MISNTKLTRNLAKLMLVAVLFVSCERKNVKSIETFGGSKFVVTHKDITFYKNYNLQLKNKDTIFWVTVINFDGKNINVGDTIR